MALLKRLSLAAPLLLAALTGPARPFQDPTGTPVITPHPRPEHRFSIAPPSLPPADLHAEASMVLVPVQVTDDSGALVRNLHKQDFHVFEDGVEQVVTDFAIEEAPVSVGFLLDSSSSMRNKMRKSAEAASAFFQTANRDDEFFLVEFSENAKLSVPFTTDADQVYKRVSHARALGRTSLLDAVHLALVQMKHARNTRKAIVIVSDGGDNRSRYTAKQIAGAMQESEVQIYAMGIFDPVDQRNRTPEEKNGPQLLGELAQDSGGEYFSVDSIDNLPQIATRIGEQLRSQYLLGYAPANTERDGKFRRIQVGLADSAQAPGTEVRYRHGYYAPAK